MHKNLKTTKANNFHRRFFLLTNKGEKYSENTLTHIHRPHRKFCGGGRKIVIKLKAKRKKEFQRHYYILPSAYECGTFLSHSLYYKIVRSVSFALTAGGRLSVTAIWRRPCSERQAGKKRRKKKGMEWKKKKNPINFTFSFFFLSPSSHTGVGY